MSVETSSRFDEPQLALALGRFIMAFAHLEAVLEDAITGLGGRDAQISDILISQLSFRALVDSWASAFSRLVADGQMLAEMAEIRTQVYRLEESRNQYIHSAWYPLLTSETTSEVIRIKKLRKPHDGVHHIAYPTPVAEVVARTQDIEITSRRLDDLTEKSGFTTSWLTVSPEDLDAS
jgi:hypothetical protein